MAELSVLFSVLLRLVSRSIVAAPILFSPCGKKPLMMLRNSKEYQVALEKLGDYHGVIDDASFEKLEEFVCQMYSVRGERNGLSIFSKNFKVTNVNENFMKSAINYDGSSIPPCASELRQQVLRASYIANIWCNANGSLPH